ncbi:MAG: TIGR01777 family oxidoreductase [Terrimicrobiaceae bacterium]
MQPRRLGIVGASGFVGRTLRDLAMKEGYEVVCFSRQERPGFRVFKDAKDLKDLDAVINLAGEPILGLWTADRRKKILESRVQGTRQIVEAIVSGKPRFPTLVNGSAIGYYGDTGDHLVDEDSPVGSGFLASTCQAWEAATVPAAAAGVRVVLVRIGFVIGNGGAMSLIRPAFRLGLGGRLGSGRQWMSCIHVEDVAGMILWALRDDRISGPVNAVMPDPVTNLEFTKTLAESLHRPAILPAPAFALKLALGDLSHVMLDSARVMPGVAARLGYSYRFPTLAGAFQSLESPK